MKKGFLLSLFTLITSMKAYASFPVFIWDNQEGLMKPVSCQITANETIPFRISRFWGQGQNKGIENLRNYKGVRQSHLINGSLVKLIPARKKRDYEHIEVVGLNQGASVQKTRWFSERLDRGYLFHKSLVPLDDYILEVDSKELGEDAKTLGVNKSSFWKIESSDSYYNIKCGDKGREYTLFRVYDSLQDSDPKAFVGVYWDETKLFKNFVTHEYYEDRDENTELARAYNIQDLINSSEAEIAVVEDKVEEASEEGIDRLIQELQGNSYFGASNKSLKGLSPLAPKEEIEAPQEVTTTATTEENLDVEEVVKSMENQVCVPSKTLNVRSEELDTVLFRASKNEKVKIFQSWDTEDTKVKVIDGVEYTFVKVEFADREESDQKVGWIAEKFISPFGQCRYQIEKKERGIPVDTQITGLDDKKCCDFPTVKKPTHSYTSGMRMFNARRGGGKRAHAACDLYRYIDEPALSVAPGKVVRGLYYFYQGTYAIEVKHSGGFIVRYGELTGKKASGVAEGKSVKMGQKLGFIGKVNSNCCRPMLHFELYRGNKKGSLSTNGNKYRRRSDLMNPTKYLLKWEEANL